MFRTRTVFVAGVAALGLLAAGCGSDDSDSAKPATSAVMDHGTTDTSTPAATRSDFNAADVSFLEMMYPHHAQAVKMAELVPSRSQNQQLITLAENVKKAQSPEMAQITTLLQSFGKPAPSAGMGHAMPGMMTDEQMSKLAGLHGADFDTLWMQMMIEHHQGAIGMANTELAQGTNAEAKALAQSIVTAQQTEIDQMNGMLGNK